MLGMNCPSFAQGKIVSLGLAMKSKIGCSGRIPQIHTNVLNAINPLLKKPKVQIQKLSRLRLNSVTKSRQLKGSTVKGDRHLAKHEVPSKSISTGYLLKCNTIDYANKRIVLKLWQAIHQIIDKD